MKLIKQQYFYLISGLPVISLQQTHLPFSVKIYLGELKDKISEEDFELVCMLYNIRDNSSLLDILRAAENTGNEFLIQWIEFELNLKNLLLLMSNRKHILPFSDIILEANDMATLMKVNPSADFSTQTSIDFMQQVENIIETENLIESEHKIDALRWKKAEEMTFFNYFTIEAILCFIIKLMIIERWTMLQQDQETEFLPAILKSFTEKIKMPVAIN